MNPTPAFRRGRLLALLCALALPVGCARPTPLAGPAVLAPPPAPPDATPSPPSPDPTPPLVRSLSRMPRLRPVATDSRSEILTLAGREQSGLTGQIGVKGALMFPVKATRAEN